MAKRRSEQGDLGLRDTEMNILMGLLYPKLFFSRDTNGKKTKTTFGSEEPKADGDENFFPGGTIEAFSSFREGIGGNVVAEKALVFVRIS
jgi:hypothetical protein